CCHPDRSGTRRNSRGGTGAARACRCPGHRPPILARESARPCRCSMPGTRHACARSARPARRHFGSTRRTIRRPRKNRRPRRRSEYRARRAPPRKSADSPPDRPPRSADDRSGGRVRLHWLPWSFLRSKRSEAGAGEQLQLFVRQIAAIRLARCGTGDEVAIGLRVYRSHLAAIGGAGAVAEFPDAIAALVAIDIAPADNHLLRIRTLGAVIRLDIQLAFGL